MDESEQINTSAVERVEQAQALAASLSEKQAQNAAKVAALQQERNGLAFAVHADGSSKASKRMAEVTAQMLPATFEAETIAVALQQANERLAAARSAVEREAAKAVALKLQEKLAAQDERAADFDQCCADLIAIAKELEAEQNNINALCAELGVSMPPTGAQFMAYMPLVTTTCLQQLPWRRAYPFLAPRDRRHAVPLWKSWTDGGRRAIAGLLGEQSASTAHVTDEAA